MDPAITGLVAANIAFIGTHFALSHPLRAPLVGRMGEKGFLGFYSAVSLAALVWVAMAFRLVGKGQPMLWNGRAELLWIFASALTLVALVLIVGGLRGNPAAPDTSPEAVARAVPGGVYNVTRHPMMWGIAIWALSHILIAPNARTIITAGSMGLLALLGAHFQDRKKEALQGEAWKHWEAQTSYWPRWSALTQAGIILWLVAAVLWLLLSWAHVWLAYVPAGPWRWIGG